MSEGEAPTCCAYHTSGGYEWIACGVDPYDPTWEEDAPAGNTWGSFRDGMRRYWRSRANDCGR